MNDLKVQDFGDQQLLTGNFIVPFEQNHRFTGRKAFLEILKQKLFDQAPKTYAHRVALYGMGGIGKTQVALEYVYTDKTTYQRIYWLTAVDQASLLSGYQKIAKDAGLKVRLDMNPMEVSETVLRWLQQQQSWLIVIDNLDDTEVVNGLLPENGPRKHTLITTRNPNSYGIPAEGLEVPLLDLEDAIELLSILSNIQILPNTPERTQAEQIVAMLGYLPLAIEQAAAYVREAVGDFVTFLKDYDEYHQELTQWVPKGNRGYPHSVATTWLAAFNAVHTNRPIAAELFRLLAFLNPDGILIDFLRSGVSSMDNGMRKVVSNDIQMSIALIELEKYSLIKWDRRGKSILVHRLVQTVVKDGMPDEDLMTFRQLVVSICKESFPQEWSIETRQRCRIYFSQVVGPLLDAKSVQTLELAEIMELVGLFLRYDGKNVESTKLLNGAINIRAAILGNDHVNTLQSMEHLANTYWHQGRMTEAAKLHEDIFVKRQAVLGDDHPDTLLSLYRLANTYEHLGKMMEAEKLRQKVLLKRKTILGDDHPVTIMSMHDLADTYFNQGRTTEAEKILEELLTKAKASLGDDDLDTLVIMSTLAKTYVENGRTTDAEKLIKEVLAKRKFSMGDNHTNTLSSMFRLAYIYGAQGRTAEAIELDEEVLEKRRTILGEHHPDTLRSMHNLAENYKNQGRMTEAIKLTEEVLTKRNVILGEGHPETLLCKSNLGCWYFLEGKKAEGMKILEEVLAKRKAILGDDHPETRTSRDNLALAVSFSRNDRNLEQSC
jgi:tetratricopeptide (TPR) repeat protein